MNESEVTQATEVLPAETPSEVTPGESKSVAETQPSLEDLVKQSQEKDAEIQRLRQTVGKHATRESKLREQAEAIVSLREDMAGIKSALNKALGIEEEVVQPKKETVVPPGRDKDIDDFLSLAGEHDMMTYDADSNPILSGVALEAVQDDRSPKEALKHLRTKLSEKQKDEITKIATQMAQVEVQRKLKESGFTTGAISGPSAPSVDLNKLSPHDQIAHGVAQKEKEKLRR
jgi:hypothetical protein